MVGVDGRRDCSVVWMRRNSASPNSRRGSTGTTGSRNASSGSAAMTHFLLVLATQHGSRAGEECLGRVEASAQMLRDLRDRQSIEVAQRERGPLGDGQTDERGVRRLGVEPFVPRVVDVLEQWFGGGQAALL